MQSYITLESPCVCRLLNTPIYTFTILMPKSSDLSVSVHSEITSTFPVKFPDAHAHPFKYQVSPWSVFIREGSNWLTLFEKFMTFQRMVSHLSSLNLDVHRGTTENR